MTIGDGSVTVKKKYRHPSSLTVSSDYRKGDDGDDTFSFLRARISIDVITIYM